MKITTFHDTFHARQRSVERNIALPVMMDVVKYPTARRQLRRGRYGGMMYRFTKQSADETIEVIAEVKKTECWLLTAYRL